MLDELASGVPSAAAPDIERAFALAHHGTALTLFVVPGLIALVIEPIMFLLADRYPRRWFISGGLAGMAVSAAVAAFAQSAAVLAITIGAWWIANGLASPLAQATLVDQAPDEQGRARTMARWTLWSIAGDMLAPLLLGGLVAYGLGWRVAFGVLAAILGAWAIVIGWRPIPTAAPPAGDDGDTGERTSLWQALQLALRDRVLLVWLFGVALCDLLDEILVVFASLHVRSALGGGAGWQTAMLVALTVGSAIGVAVLDRLLLRYTERQLLIAIGLACAASYLGWLLAPTPWLSVALFAPVGATSACLYPLAAARAYARLPGRSGAVLAASQLFTPLGLMLPWLLGLLADGAGTWVALAVLIVQPLGLVALAATAAVAAAPARRTADTAD